MKNGMYGFIYCTTNLINNKKYIGQHKYCGRIDKYYLGSGVALSRAVKKYGRDNFKREIICECSTLEELNGKEIYYIKLLDAINSKDFYNIGLGGNGSEHGNEWWLRATPEQIAHANAIRSEKMSGRNNPFYGKKHSDETKKKLSKLASQRTGDKNPFYGKHISTEHRKKMQEAQGSLIGERNPFYGKKHSLETRKMISEKARQRALAPDYCGNNSIPVVLHNIKNGETKTFPNTRWCFKYLEDNDLNVRTTRCGTNKFKFNTFRGLVQNQVVFNNMIARRVNTIKV